MRIRKYVQIRLKKSPARKKDGLQQVKIRVFIGSNDYGKFRNKITLEVNVLDEINNPVLASSSEFDNRKSNKTLNLAILKNEAKIQDAVVQMLHNFFRMVKQNLKIKSFIGTSENAVLIQIWSALITILLLSVLKTKALYKWHMSNMVGFIRLNLFVKIDLFEWLNHPFLQDNAPPGQIQLDLF